MLSASIVATLLVLLPSAFADCGSFQIDRRIQNLTTYTTIGQSTIVSNLVNCTADRIEENNFPDAPSSLNCSSSCPLWVQDRYLLNIDRQLNISGDISQDAADQIFELVRPDFPVNSENFTNFNASWTYLVPHEEMCVEEGQARYWSFTPFLRCIEGVLSDCSGEGSPSDGTAFRACGVETLVQYNEELIPHPLGSMIAVITGGFDERPAPENATVIQDGTEGDQTSAASSLKHVWSQPLTIAIFLSISSQLFF